VRLIVYGFYLLVPIWAARALSADPDNLLVVRAVRGIFDGVSPYANQRFLYPPSSVLFGLLEAPFSDRFLRHSVPFGLAALLVIGWWALLRLFDVPFASWLGTLGICAAPFFLPFSNLVWLGSWTGPVAALTGVALLLMGKGRWIAAGAVVGLSIAFKPMLVPLGLIFLLAHKWRGLAVAAGLPMVVAGLMLAFIPDPELFFTKTIPFMLAGQDEYARPFDASLVGILPRFGVHGRIVGVLRLATAATAIVLAVLRWRRAGHEGLRIVETSSILLLGTFLVLTPGFDHYSLLVVPPLMASVVVPGSVARSVWYWLALVPQSNEFRLKELDDIRRRAYKDFFMFLVIFGALAVKSVIRASKPLPTTGEAQGVDDPDDAVGERDPMLPSQRVPTRTGVDHPAR
jgi:arabinofuranan 3-O-arabinosyltransferase